MTDTVIREEALRGRVFGYPAMVDPETAEAFSSITDEYAQDQIAENREKTDNYLLPIIQRLGAHRMLDAGCGVGTMVTYLNELGYDAHGFDLLENAHRWASQDLPRDRFAVAEPIGLELPYPDRTFDFLFSFGAIEHVGTTNGHSDRRADYHEIRTQWVHELYRTLRVGGSMLLAGPNRNFPVDTAHALDTRASKLEHWLSNKVGVTIHRPVGEYFLWGYPDVRRYCEGLSYRMEGLSVHGLAKYSRVPGVVRSFAEGYVKHLPKPLLATGFNPWVAALITRTA